MRRLQSTSFTHIHITDETIKMFKTFCKFSYTLLVPEEKKRMESMKQSYCSEAEAYAWHIIKYLFKLCRSDVWATERTNEHVLCTECKTKIALVYFIHKKREEKSNVKQFLPHDVNASHELIWRLYCSQSVDAIVDHVIISRIHPHLMNI